MFVTVVNLCALVENGGQYLSYLFVVVGCDYFCYRGRSGVVAAISKGVPIFWCAQN